MAQLLFYDERRGKMCNGTRITIEEWAGDNGIVLDNEQITELMEAIDASESMSMPNGYGVGMIQTREQSEIKRLKNQIDMLERYIVSKGYYIILHDDCITRMYMKNWGDRSYSEHETFR